MSRADDLANLGRQMAVSQGVLDGRPQGDWLAYGQACKDAFAHGRPVPVLRPASAPPAPPPGSFRQAPALRAACTPPVEREFGERRSFLGRVVWGLMWRYGVLVVLLIMAQNQAQKPWLVIAGVLFAGLLLGLWRRRWALARLWRTAVVAGGAVYVAPLFSVYPDVLVGSIGALTLAPFVATWRRR